MSSITVRARLSSALPFAMLASAALALPACGGDGGGGGAEEVDNPMVVEQGKATGTASVQLTTLMPGADSAAAQGPITQVGNSINTLVNQYRAAKLQAQAGVSALTQAQTAAENTVDYTGDHLSASLNYDTAGVNYTYAVELDLPAVNGGRQIDGTFDLDFEVTSAQYNIKYGYHAVYDTFTVDSAGCATGGSIAVDYNWDLSGALYDQLPSDQRAAVEDQLGGTGTVTIEFGPACGDAKVFAE